MTDYKPGDLVRVNGDDAVVRRVNDDTSVVIDSEGGGFTVKPSWLTPVAPPLHPAYANAQPGDVVRADGRVWERKESGRWWRGFIWHYTADLAALDPNPVRLVLLPSVEALAFRCNGSPASIHAWLADRERGK